jgi:hypothetical protein
MVTAGTIFFGNPDERIFWGVVAFGLGTFFLSDELGVV